MGTSLHDPLGNLLYTLPYMLKIGFLYAIYRDLPIVPTIEKFCYEVTFAYPINTAIWSYILNRVRKGDWKREISVGVISRKSAFYIPVALFFIPLLHKLPKTYSTSAVNIHKQPDNCNFLPSHSLLLFLCFSYSLPLLSVYR